MKKLNRDVIIWGNTSISEKYIDSALKKNLTVNMGKDESIIDENQIFFYFQDSYLTSDGWFDTQKLFEIVELFGYCFENDISVTDKVLVICCDTNPGDTKRIHEILNPMNINVCFIPLHNTNIKPPQLPIGTLNPLVVSIISDYLNKTFFDNVHLYSMTSTTSEIINLGLSVTKLSNNLELINYKNILTRNSILEEYPLIESFLEHKTFLEYKEDILRNEVMSKYITTKNIPNNVAKRVEDEKRTNVQFIISEFIKSDISKDTEIIVEGICYPNSSFVDYNKHRIVMEIISLGYKVIIVESEDFIRGKTPKEMVNDFGDNVKFYNKGSKVQGYTIPL